MSGTRGGLAGSSRWGSGWRWRCCCSWPGRRGRGKYAVAQCGWYVGADADWADTTGGAKFRPDAYCVPPAGADPFDGAHLKSFTRDGQGTVSGTRFARWRWTAPPGTGITQVRGTWWHALHDGIEQRLGVDAGNGGFDPFAGAAAPTSARATSSPASRRRRRRSKTACSAPGPRANGAALERRLVVGAAGADDHGPGRRCARRRDRRRHRRRRLAPRRPERRLLGGDRRGRASASARRASTAPGSTSPSTPARRR